MFHSAVIPGDAQHRTRYERGAGFAAVAALRNDETRMPLSSMGATCLALPTRSGVLTCFLALRR